MAFVVPTFNLACGVYTGPYLSRVLREASLPCNLALGRRVQQAGNDYAAITFGGAAPCLLVPAESDVRDLSTGGPQDVIECPAGSGRWYQVTCVDDVAKGFDNEYRIVAVQKIYDGATGGVYTGLVWPTPIP